MKNDVNERRFGDFVDTAESKKSKPIHLIYSPGLEIPNGTIIGKIIGSNPKKLIELGLYEWPLSDSSTFIQRVEADEKGQFQFNNIDLSEFRSA